MFVNSPSADLPIMSNGANLVITIQKNTKTPMEKYAPCILIKEFLSSDTSFSLRLFAKISCLFIYILLSLQSFLYTYSISLPSFIVNRNNIFLKIYR